MSLFLVKFEYFGQNNNRMNIHQSQNLTELGRFLTQKTPILYFLTLSVFFGILMVVFGQPTGLLVFTTQLTDTNPQLQMTYTTVAGLLTLIVSRLLLYLVSRRQSMSPMECFIWLLAELIATIAVLCFTLWQVSGGGRLMLAPLAGDFLLGVIAIEALPYIISFLVFRLRESQDEVERLQEELQHLQRPDTQSPVSAGDRTVNFYDKGNRLVFSTAGNNILYIEAADNYVNIHYMNDGHEETFILHNTLKEMERMMHGTQLLRCHRGYMVNIGNVKLLRKEGSAFLLELNGSVKTIPVTKTYAATITERLAPTHN